MNAILDSDSFLPQDVCDSSCLAVSLVSWCILFWIQHSLVHPRFSSSATFFPFLLRPHTKNKGFMILWPRIWLASCSYLSCKDASASLKKTSKKSCFSAYMLFFSFPSGVLYEVLVSNNSFILDASTSYLREKKMYFSLKKGDLEHICNKTWFFPFYICSETFDFCFLTLSGLRASVCILDLQCMTRSFLSVLLLYLIGNVSTFFCSYK